MKTTFDTRLKEAMKDNNFKQIDIVEKSAHFYKETGVKISKTDLSQYVNGKTEPGNKKLYVLAKILNVSEAWLLGYDVPKERTSDEERTIHNSFETIAAHLDGELTGEEWEEVIQYANYIRNKRK